MLNVVEKIVFEIRTQIDFLCLSNGFGTLINELFLNLRGFSTAKTVKISGGDELLKPPPSYSKLLRMSQPSA